ncbi:BirA family transcriptional regulator, biotin operon repressor / biotin-[acetyl-CoA-carboxylase] ligase [Pustulibacterium marinum]|uniref:BirA family transcriptional regulator, biotin operon repressor / biotin-[acetyl-CoA-carboxylase] ligase n=1 Tax=Pustulibacterium marinum TaxID=1224947 RepID=A0A1I7HQ10_9FLAO|nr:biotin--[acetyl-CoA-carboxylase] ligase [Pustulibacterium marinum]SFU62516.1 BirA family transcriptional regulator, biotin operon repressor / biotin-[acetyl-CoA-carboxylase] ligase [Pustulibacterium marinum]
MHLIKLSATESTNSFLRNLLREKEPNDLTVVITRHQTRGRGQMGTTWMSEADKNLTFSVYKKMSCLAVHQQFYISMGVSLAIHRALSKFTIPDLKIKWPNDILSGNSKICGILIENIIKQGQLTAAIVGIGLNVNQLEFEGLQSVSSIKRITGVHYHLEEIMNEIIAQLRVVVRAIEQGKLADIKEKYEELLFRKDKPSTFKDLEGNLFMGFIRYVNESGKLVIDVENDHKQEFELKEIKLLY